jgi:hypothetical protein
MEVLRKLKRVKELESGKMGIRQSEGKVMRSRESLVLKASRHREDMMLLDGCILFSAKGSEIQVPTTHHEGGVVSEQGSPIDRTRGVLEDEGTKSSERDGTLSHRRESMGTCRSIFFVKLRRLE